MVMQNVIWEKIGTILNMLHCEDVKRESYLHLPEADEALRPATHSLPSSASSVQASLAIAVMPSFA